MSALEDPREDPLLTATQAGELLGVSRWTVYDWVRERRIPCLRLAPRTLRFRRSSLEAWIREQEQAAR